MRRSISQFGSPYFLGLKMLRSQKRERQLEQKFSRE